MTTHNFQNFQKFHFGSFQFGCVLLGKIAQISLKERIKVSDGAENLENALFCMGKPLDEFVGSGGGDLQTTFSARRWSPKPLTKKKKKPRSARHFLITPCAGLCALKTMLYSTVARRIAKIDLKS